MRNDERRRERTCTSKRAFKTKEYAGMFLENVLKRTGEMDVYRCGFCGEYHLGHRPGVHRVYSVR
jgi:hypothetical protein